MFSQISFRPMSVMLALACVVGLLACCGSPTSTAVPEPKPTQAGGAFESPLPTPVVLGALILEPGMGGAKGRIAASPAEWQGQQVTVFFATYYEGGETQGGFFVLEPSQAPSTLPDASGAFQIGALPPRKYVVVIGPDAEKALAIQEDARPKVFEIVAGEVTDLGSVRLP
ncbi:MAG TPA: hypothetical protein PKO09_00010 [Anaerolineae bacterium]|nr:hypothetical protein [Anaerolineae bacterium]